MAHCICFQVILKMYGSSLPSYPYDSKYSLSLTGDRYTYLLFFFFFPVHLIFRKNWRSLRTGLCSSFLYLFHLGLACCLRWKRSQWCNVNWMNEIWCLIYNILEQQIIIQRWICQIAKHSDYLSIGQNL